MIYREEYAAAAVDIEGTCNLYHAKAEFVYDKYQLSIGPDWYADNAKLTCLHIGQIDFTRGQAVVMFGEDAIVRLEDAISAERNDAVKFDGRLEAAG